MGLQISKKIIIPESVTEIGGDDVHDSAFKDCRSLQEIVIPNLVTKIGYGAFKGCTALQNVVIPDSVTKIGNSAFSNCI